MWNTEFYRELFTSVSAADRIKTVAKQYGARLFGRYHYFAVQQTHFTHSLAHCVILCVLYFVTQRYSTHTCSEDRAHTCTPECTLCVRSSKSWELYDE